MDSPSKSANICWLDLLDQLKHAPETEPDIVEDRIQGLGQSHRQTREIIGSSIVVQMHKPCVTVIARHLNYRFMYAEAYWILSGSNKLSEIEPWCKPMGRFSDDGIILQGAYGPRVIEQLEYVVNTLRRNKNSRQAVISIWRPNPGVSKDIPCTVSTQFIIRHNRLHLIHEMRSSDIWLGWSYDVFNFSMLAMYVGLKLRQHHPELILGDLHFRAGSLHLYHDDYKRACEIMDQPITIPYSAFAMKYFKDEQELIDMLKKRRDDEHDPIMWFYEKR